MTFEFPKRVAENIGQFTGRTWLLPKLLEWWDETDSRIFLLTGGPGTGKSMILAWLADGPAPSDAVAAEQLTRLRTAVKAAHFCQAASRNITPQAFAENIVNQLTGAVKGFADALAATLAERVQISAPQKIGTVATGATVTGVSIGRIDLGALGDELSFDRAFTQPLKKLYASGHSEPMLILVDALDETLGYTGDKILVELLSTLDDLPAEVRILLTTRDDPRVLAFYDDVKPFDLIKDAPLNIDDVQEYVAYRLNGSTALAHARRDDFARRVATHAKGVFLYAAIVLDELLPRIPQIPDLERYPLPVGLSGLYRAFLKRELGTEDKGRRWHQIYKLLLGLIAVAQGDGLTATQLSELIGQEVAEPLDACKQYLSGEVPEGPFRPFHKSFTDFLLEDKKNIRYHIDAQSMHRRIAEYYQAYKGDWSKCDDYGLKHLAAHLASGDQIAELVTLIDRSWMQVRYERACFTYAEFQADIDLARQTIGRTSFPQVGDLIHLKSAALAVQEHVKVYENQDLAILVGLGRSEEALINARLRNTCQGQFEGLLTIHSELMRSQKSSMAAALIHDIHIAAKGIGDSREQVRALCSLARHLSRTAYPGTAEVLDDIERCVHRIQDDRHRAAAKCEFVSTLVESTRLRDAEQIASSIDDDVQQAFAFESIAISLADSGHFDEAKRIVGLINPTSTFGKAAVQRTQVKCLVGIARALANVDDARAEEMFKDAEQDAMAIEDAYMRDDALHEITAALTHSGRLYQAQRVAAAIHDWRKSQALLRLVTAFARKGDFNQAEALVDAIPDREWRPSALREIAEELAAIGRYDEARRIDQRLTDISGRASVLRAIAAGLVQKGDHRAREVLGEALGLSLAIRSTSDREGALRHLVNIHLQAQDLDGARKVFEMLQQQRALKHIEREYCAALRWLATALASVQDPHAERLIESVRVTINRLEDIWQTDEKRQFAINLSRVGRFHQAWEVLESNKNDLQREEAWWELGICMARLGDNRSDEALKQGRAAVLEIRNDQARDETLVKFVAVLIKERRFEMAEDVITFVKDIRRRCDALSSLAVVLHPDNHTRSRELFALVEQTAREEWKYGRDEALAGLVSALATSNEFEDGMRVASTIETDGLRIEALCRLAERYVLAGDSRGQLMFSEGLWVATSGELGDSCYDARELRREAAQFSREGDPRATALWAKAEQVAGSLWAGWVWENSQYRAEGFCDLAIALTRANDPRSHSTIDLAHRAAVEIPYENGRDQTLRRLIDGLIDVNRLDTAERVLSDIHGESDRLMVVRELIKAYTTAAQPKSALRVARSVSSDYERREILRDVAVAFARVNQISDALEVLEETSLDGFIGALGRVHAAWSAASPGSVIASMRAVTSVAAWVRPDWDEIHKALMT